MNETKTGSLGILIKINKQARFIRKKTFDNVIQ